MADDDEDDSSKTEDPTAKRLQDAREQGNLPISRDLATWVLLLGIVFSVSFLLPSITVHMMTPLTALLAQSGEIEMSPTSTPAVLGRFFGEVGWPMMAVIFLVFAFGIIGWLVQTGMMFNVTLLSPKWERINPMEGVKRLFSMNSMVELIKSIMKLIVVGWVGYTFLESDFFKSSSMTGMDNAGMVNLTYQLASDVLFAIFLAFTGVMLVDVIYQRFTYFKNMRMTKTQVKEEYRQSEGDPHVKARLKGIRMEKARRRMMAAVPEADVVVTNPTHFAVALKYDPNTMQAPVVLAKGQDFLALKIREIADEHKVPIISNPPLARALYASVEIDQEVPPQHYRAVAEVISYIFRLRKAKR